MAKRVEGLTEKILEYAKTEFLEKGYENASLRSIARKAGLTTGAIYIRYPDKASLFSALVNEAADGLVETVRSIHDDVLMMPKEQRTEALNERSELRYKVFTDYIYQHFDEFKLFLNCSDGPLFSEFIHRLVEIEVVDTFKLAKNSGSDAISKGRLTTEFAHLVSESFFTGVFQVVIHDMPRERGENYIKQLRGFFSAGWKTIL